jgi:hypothetical protein
MDFIPMVWTPNSVPIKMEPYPQIAFGLYTARIEG